MFSRRFPVCALLSVALLSGLLRPVTVRAQSAVTPAEEMANAYNAAMLAFNQGNWPAAVSGLEKVIAMVTEPKEQAKIGSIHYTLGAAYFNAKDYPKAIEALTTFLKKYPADPRVGDARLAIARSTFLKKDYAGATALFAALESVPALREMALEAQAQCYKELNQPDGEILIYEKLIAPEIKTVSQANGASRLAQLFLQKKDSTKALDLVNKLHARISLVDNVVALNSLTVTLGDEFAEAKSYPQALAAYRAVRTRDEVLAFQRLRIAAMEKRMAANLETARGNAQNYMAATGAQHRHQSRRGRRYPAAGRIRETAGLHARHPLSYGESVVRLGQEVGSDRRL